MATSQYADFKKVYNARIVSCEVRTISCPFTAIAALLFSISLQAQERFYSNNSRQYQLQFKNQMGQLSKACHLLEKKRKRKSKIHFFAKSKPKQYEGNGRILSNPDPRPKPVATKSPEPKPTVTAKATEIPTPEKLEALHHKEDNVLVENKLPKPTSEKHERIRKEVEDHLKTKKDNEPIDLAPLYFTFAEDEFSVVDMDPFLIAVEYALQGRIILIEGHTDNRGDASYNLCSIWALAMIIFPLWVMVRELQSMTTQPSRADN